MALDQIDLYSVARCKGWGEVDEPLAHKRPKKGKEYRIFTNINE